MKVEWVCRDGTKNHEWEVAFDRCAKCGVTKLEITYGEVPEFGTVKTWANQSKWQKNDPYTNEEFKNYVNDAIREGQRLISSDLNSMFSSGATMSLGFIRKKYEDDL